MKAFDRELVSGSVARSVWKLAWPAVLLRLVDGLHSLVDHILVGNFVGHHGNAAVGAAWLLFLMVVLGLASLFQGMVVFVSRYAGMQDRDNLSWVVYQTFLATVYLFVFFIAPVGFLIAPHALALVNVTPEVHAHALPYLRIMFTCAAPLFLSMMLAMAFQASGDPKTPLMLGALTTSLNIGLSITLITGLGPFPAMGAAGAALATSLAPICSILIGLSLIYRRKMIIQPPPRYTLKLDIALLKDTARIGLPTGIQAVMLNFGGVLLFRKLGVLPHSAAAQAAFTICYTQIFSLVTWAGFGLRIAAATLMGQNVGAGDVARGKRSVYAAAGLGVTWAALLGLVFWFAPGP
ncbi:MAG: MATE family efflux transporter, partial [Candidatus Hydrogenedentota bacterium]